MKNIWVFFLIVCSQNVTLIFFKMMNDYQMMKFMTMIDLYDTLTE